MYRKSCVLLRNTLVHIWDKTEEDFMIQTNDTRRLTWNEIQQFYPNQYVAIREAELGVPNKAIVKSGIVEYMDIQEIKFKECSCREEYLKKFDELKALCENGLVIRYTNPNSIFLTKSYALPNEILTRQDIYKYFHGELLGLTDVVYADAFEDEFGEIGNYTAARVEYVGLSPFEFKILQYCQMTVMNQYINTNHFTNEENQRKNQIDICDRLEKDAFLFEKVEQVPELCLFAVKCNGWAIQRIKEQTPELCMEAVKQNPMVIQCVKEQTLELHMEAVRRNGLALKYIKEQTTQLCIEAIRQNFWSFRYVKEQTSELYKMALELETKKYGKYQYKRKSILQFIKEPTYEMYLEALEKDCNNFRFIQNPTPELCLFAVKRMGKIIKEVKNKTRELCLAAVAQNGEALEYLKEEQTEEICLAAVKQNGNSLRYVKKQTPEICVAAVKQNKEAMRYVEVLTEEILEAYADDNGDARKILNEQGKLQENDFVVQHTNLNQDFLSDKTDFPQEIIKKEEIRKLLHNQGYALTDLIYKDAAENQWEYIAARIKYVGLAKDELRRLEKEEPIFVEWNYPEDEEINRFSRVQLSTKEEMLHGDTEETKILKRVQKDASVLAEIEQTPELCLKAVEVNPFVLKYVKEQTPEICKRAVLYYGRALQYVKEQTLDICITAILENAHAIQYVRIPNPKLCWLAVRTNGFAIQCVPEQTSELCMEAVRQNGMALSCIENQTPELCMEAVKQNSGALKYVKKQTPELCMMAVKNDYRTFRYVKEQTPELYAVALDGEPSKENWTYKDFRITQYMKAPTEEINVTATRKDTK